MIAIPFVFNGTEEQFRALIPGPTQYWGQWTGTTMGAGFVGVILAHNPNVRAHAHPQMTFLPSHGSNALSSAHLSACSNLNVGITSGDTLSDAITKIHGANSSEFLHPDRF